VKKLFAKIARKREEQDGYVLVMTAFLLLVLMLMAAFTIDVGLWYSRANRLQRAADAAALAGVTYMPNVTQAYAVAQDAAQKNGFDPSDLAINIVPASVAGAPRRLQVTLTDNNVPTIFGGVVMNHITITRTAMAEYVSQVPVGSPLNAIGTGDQPGFAPGGGTQGFYLAVGGFCTAKEDGTTATASRRRATCIRAARRVTRIHRRSSTTSNIEPRATTTSSTSRAATRTPPFPARRARPPPATSRSKRTTRCSIPAIPRTRPIPARIRSSRCRAIRRTARSR